MNEFRGKRIAVLGAAATGMAAAPVLARLGAEVWVFDAKPADALGEAPARLAPVARLFLGDPDYAQLEECDLIVPSPGVPCEAPALQDAVRRGTPVLSEIEIAYRIARAPLVAVTGTNGKTSTVFMIAEVLRTGGCAAVVAGNALARGRQAPLIQAAESTPADAWIVAEVSSFQLEWVTQFRPRVAVITNITSDHLNRHGSVEAYAAAKARLLDAQTDADWTVLNLDNPLTHSLTSRARGRLLRFSRELHPFAGTWVEGTGEARRLWGRLPGAGNHGGLSDHGGLPLLGAAGLRVPGEHTLENALAAAAVGLAVGIEPAAIAAGLERFPGVPDRLESLGCVHGVEYVNNTMCTNVDAAVRSVQAYTRPVVLIAGGKNKDLDFEPLGREIATRVKALITIGDDGAAIAGAARRHGFDRIRAAGSMAEAVQAAAAEAGAGDVVLLAPACASFDWYRSFEARGEDFRRQVERLRESAEGV